MMASTQKEDSAVVAPTCFFVTLFLFFLFFFFELPGFHVGHGNQLVGVVVRESHVRSTKIKKRQKSEGSGGISMKFCYRYMEFGGLDRGASPSL